MGSPALFSGTFVKFLKAKLNLFDVAQILTGTDDPRSVATDAKKGSILLRQAAKGQLFLKLDDGSTTNWELVSTEDIFGLSGDPASGFNLAYSDNFDVGPTDPTSLVRSVETHGTYDDVRDLFRILCDKSLTCTTVGLNYTLSGAPSFTLAVGDVIWDNTQTTWRRIASILTTSTGTLDAAFPVDLSVSSVMCSQAVWTKDLVNFIGSSSESTRPRDFYPSENISQVSIDYFDSLVSQDTTPDYIDEARIVAVGSNDGVYTDTSSFPTSDKFNGIFTRPQAPDQIDNYPFLPPANGSIAYNVAGNGDEQIPSSTTNYKGQVFTATSDTYVDSVSVDIINPGLNVSTSLVSLYLYATTGGLPTGAPIATATETYGINTLPASYGTPRTFTFPTSVPVTNGVQYAWIVRVSAGYLSPFVVIRRENPGAYAGGNIVESVNSGGSWGDYGYDFTGWSVNYSTPIHRLFLGYFCNPNNVSVTTGANLLAYKVSFVEQEILGTGGILNSAFAMSDGSGTIQNMLSQPYNVSGKTRVALTWNYTPSIHQGETVSDLDVIVDGQMIPRYVSGVTQDAYWLEVPGSTDTIEFWDDLTGTPLSIDIRKREGTIDTSDDNTTNLALLFSPQLLTTSTVLVRRPYQRIFADSTSAPFTITLPTTPTVGDRVLIQDPTGMWFTNNVTIDRNGNNIDGVAGNDTLDVNNAWIEYEYHSVTRGWVTRV